MCGKCATIDVRNALAQRIQRQTAKYASQAETSVIIASACQDTILMEFRRALHVRCNVARARLWECVSRAAARIA